MLKKMEQTGCDFFADVHGASGLGFQGLVRMQCNTLRLDVTAEENRQQQQQQCHQQQTMPQAVNS